MKKHNAYFSFLAWCLIIITLTNTISSYNLNTTNQAFIPHKLWKYIDNNNDRYNLIRPAKNTTTIKNNTFDYLVIGGGSGGIATARRASNYNIHVALIEQSRLGGTCVNNGCIPKKLLWNAAGIANTLKGMQYYGFSSKEIKLSDWGYLKEGVEGYIKRLNGIYERNLCNSNVTVIDGFARFSGERKGGKHVIEVVVQDGDGTRLEYYYARHVVIAVGSRPTIEENYVGDGIRENSITR